ncbi:tryptophan aminotransferase-related protein 2-like isoform X2 [Lotus japonicus]|uniref:tryptophan aminotransferase-related protein 2-like isoform X2 n=1 Tax=Lotus japonicus TaxID=34305 RepID=UPI002588215C|nr:tryptophan aminotransferase-related protein 2-like isoform X2 [Lotus japonicus]
MAKLPNVFSLRHLLVLSLALNVSFILRLLFEGEEGHDHCSCLRKERRAKIARADSNTETGEQSIKESRVAVSSSTSSLANSTCKDHPGGRNRVINLDHGDPTMYERFWRQTGEKTTITIHGWQSMSYFSDASNICWFLEAEFAKEVVRLHRVVGNAVTEGHHVVVGTGSSQLFLAALYALSPPDALQPISVVCASPYYSSYPSMTDYLKSGLYKWGGDAESFDSRDGPYIELVTSPNNPDGHVRRSMVNRSHGVLVHDLAYYWPQYTPISSPADHDLMLFTVSKTTGHAGMRIGWKQLRIVVKHSGLFSLPKFSPAFCSFFNQVSEPQPAFVWLKCEGNVEDCEGFLREHNILTRSGRHFGVSPKYVRVSMLDTDENFVHFLDRLSAIKSQ